MGLDIEDSSDVTELMQPMVSAKGYGTPFTMVPPVMRSSLQRLKDN